MRISSWALMPLLLSQVTAAFATIHDVTCGNHQEIRGCASRDDTCVINAAIAKASREGGGIVRISSGTPCIAGGDISDAIHLKSNVILEGFGWGSIIRQREDTRFLIYTDSGSPDPAADLRGITVRDLTLQGPKTRPRKQHDHLLSLNGVSDVLIDHVQFVGWIADGLYIGTSDNGDWERHNRRITIRESHFNGLDKGNRMAISIIDCDDCRIIDNYFTLTTNEGMPGAVDIEPDHAFDVVRDITVRDNRFDDIGGQNGAISLVIKYAMQTPPRGFRFTGNHVRGARMNAIFVRVDLTEPLNRLDRPALAVPLGQSMGVIVDDNVIENASQPLVLQGTSSVRFTNNIITSGEVPSLVGAGVGVTDAYLAGNLFGPTHGDDGRVVRFEGGMDGLTFENNLLRGPITFDRAGRSSFVRVLNNTFLQVATLATLIEMEPGHSADAMTTMVTGNLAAPHAHISSLRALQGGVGNSYSTTEPPSHFPVGRWSNYVQDERLPGNVKRGELITERIESSEGSDAGLLIVQWYVSMPADDAAASNDEPLYLRRASSTTDAWLPWRR